MSRFDSKKTLGVKHLYWMYFILALLAVMGFQQIFSFWFFHGWETSWLIGITGGDFSFINLMKSHGFIMYLNLLLFGWNPVGWYFTALVFHILVCWMLFYFVSKMTKNITIGFLTSLVFVVSTAHHDVVTWGSFESLYAVQTLGFLTALVIFYYYRTTGKSIFLLVTLVIFVCASVIRESGLIFIPVIFIFDLIIFQNTILSGFLKRDLDLQKLKKFILPQTLFWIVGCIYLLIWQSYGGSAHDYIDERVQFRILLFNERRFIEYIFYGILAFGQYIPPYLIPYEIFNQLKSFLAARTIYEPVMYGLNTLAGWVIYAVLLSLLLLQRKTSYFKYLLFSFTTFTVITVFYSFAWTMKPSFFLIPYSWSENRWRYFAFTMLAPFLIISLFWIVAKLSDLKKNRIPYIKYLPFVLIGVYVCVNFWQLQLIQKQMYLQNSLPSIMFYSTLKEAFPSLNNDQRIYYNRNSPGLNDFFAELSFIREDYYPNLKKLSDPWTTNDIYYAFKRMNNGENILFTDFSVEKGLQNKTNEVRRIYSSQKKTSFSPRDEGNTFRAEIRGVSPVEFRNLITIQYNISPSQEDNLSNETDQKIYALANFSEDIYLNMLNTRVNVCKTMGHPTEPFYDFRKELIIDGNLGRRSIWWADCRPAWASLDMGEVKSVVGFTFGSYNGHGSVPRSYSYQVSQNGDDWENVLSINGNTSSNKVEKTKDVVSARFIRFFVEETNERSMLILNEFSPIFDDAQEIANLYSSQEALYEDVYSLWSNASLSQRQYLQLNNLPVVWAKVTWQTDPANNVDLKDRTYYIPLIADGEYGEFTFELPESEYYTAPGQFLSRFITTLDVELPKHIEGEIVNVTFSPLQKP